MPDAPGLLDTNVFIHAHTRDSASVECRRFLAALEVGGVRAVMDPLMLHELSYALPHYLKQMARADVAEYLPMILSWDGVQGEKGMLVDAVERWRDSSGLSFADAYLASVAVEQDRPIYSKNVRELHGQGAVVPNPLPAA